VGWGRRQGGKRQDLNPFMGGKSGTPCSKGERVGQPEGWMSISGKDMRTGRGCPNWSSPTNLKEGNCWKKGFKRGGNYTGGNATS